MATSIQKLVFMTLYSRARKPPTEELANESRSTHITVAADMVFSLVTIYQGYVLCGLSDQPQTR